MIDISNIHFEISQAFPLFILQAIRAWVRGYQIVSHKTLKTMHIIVLFESRVKYGEPQPLLVTSLNVVSSGKIVSILVRQNYQFCPQRRSETHWTLATLIQEQYICEKHIIARLYLEKKLGESWMLNTLATL